MQRDQTLTDRRILLVEDDPLIALDLQDILQKAGAVVIGPASQLSNADSLVRHYRLDAAVLDVRLEIGTTLPLANRLAAAGIPFLSNQRSWRHWRRPPERAGAAQAVSV